MKTLELLKQRVLLCSSNIRLRLGLCEQSGARLCGSWLLLIWLGDFWRASKGSVWEATEGCEPRGVAPVLHTAGWRLLMEARLEDREIIKHPFDDSS